MRLWSSLLFAACLLSGCVSPPPLPPVDLSTPGWTLRQGQAIWRPSREAPEIAGDIVFATHPVLGSYLRFSKTLPIVNARWTPEQWEIEFPPENRRHSGRGDPPDRIAWFNWLLGLQGRELSDPWFFTPAPDGGGVLVNTRDGERLEIQLQP